MFKNVVRHNSSLYHKIRYRRFVISGVDCIPVSYCRLTVSGLNASDDECRTKSVPFSSPVIKEKANQLAREMGIDFTASNGWFYRFKVRRGLAFKSISGEAASVTLSEWKEKRLPDILASYSASDIYNVDESGLFYQCLPNKTFTLPAEKASRRMKESKQRVTILIGANMSGEDKLDPLIIGKAAKPRWSQSYPSSLLLQC